MEESVLGIPRYLLIIRIYPPSPTELLHSEYSSIMRMRISVGKSGGRDQKSHNVLKVREKLFVEKKKVQVSTTTYVFLATGLDLRCIILRRGDVAVAGIQYEGRTVLT